MKKIIALILTCSLVLPCLAAKPVVRANATESGAQAEVGVDLLGKPAPWWKEHPVIASLSALALSLIALDQTGVWDVDGWLKDAVGGGGGSDSEGETDVHIERAENVIIIKGDSNQADLNRRDDD